MLSLYFKISAFKEVKGFLKNLNKKGLKTVVLSNGSYDMLNSAVKNSGLSNLLSTVISVEECKKFKPNKKVYELILRKFKISRKNVVFFLVIVGIFMALLILVLKLFGLTERAAQMIFYWSCRP